MDAMEAQARQQWQALPADVRAACGESVEVPEDRFRALDRYGCCVVTVGDEVSIFACVTDHNGVGIVTSVEGERVTVADAGGRVVTVAASDVNVDWTDRTASGEE